MKRITLKKSDTKRSTFHCGGPGGQNLNKTETGVRYVHIPTGIVAASRSERSQHRNDGQAWKMLQAKLDEYVHDINTTQKQNEYAAKPSTSFGNQIRTYVLDRDVRIVDNITGYTENSAIALKRGKIDGFVYASLQYRFGN
jgi:peptide chain release factor 2